MTKIEEITTDELYDLSMKNGLQQTYIWKDWLSRKSKFIIDMEQNPLKYEKEMGIKLIRDESGHGTLVRVPKDLNIYI